MNKQHIESAVTKILATEKPPLESAVDIEISQYESSLLELKLIHKRNLQQLLYVFEKRGIKNHKTAIRIQERIAKLELPRREPAERE